MAASHTLSHPPAISQISKLGVLTLYGFGIRVRMQTGHLEIEHGVGSDRHKFRLPRVNHRLKRLVCIGDDGFITLSALRWLSDVGASFVMLDRLGKVRVVTGPVSPSEARLRRAQALALSNGNALPISRELIAAKLDGQELVLREALNDELKASRIATFRESLSACETVGAIRSIESRAALEYWSAWDDIPILFSRNDAKLVPDHWLRFGSRHSPLTGGPRLAVNPANALLNYLTALGESECRLALVACGLDAGLGFIHTDTANRDSLALDLIEVLRPSIEGWLLNWITREPLRRPDFLESSDGNCRIHSGLCRKLSETAPTWARLVAPWAEFVAHSLYRGRRTSTANVGALKTPLTQSRRRESKGAPAPEIRMPKTEHFCRGCGKSIRKEHEDCGSCAANLAIGRLGRGAQLGRIAAQKSEARMKHSASARRHALARSSWDASSQPAWLTSEFFSEKVQPLLANISTSAIRSSIGVSRWSGSRIRQGYRPHPRHWRVLAELAGIRQ
jgi:CRISPR-associated endonuclease Cas1